MAQSNRKQQNKKQSNKKQNQRQNKKQNKRQNKKQNQKQQGGDGQLGHTRMPETYFGRDPIGFSELQQSPQTEQQVDAMRQQGGDAVASTGSWKQAPTGWETAPTICQEAVEGPVKVGGKRQNKKSNKKRSNKKQSNKKQNKQNKRQ
jgi:hypothetical protein